MAQYKECISCEKATYTQALKGNAENKKITVDKLSAIYCLSDRNYHSKTHICSLFKERKEKLVE
jgi:predicted metal-dependent HD superfamily phosphohydrolase